MISKVSFDHFRRFRRYTAHFGKTNILVGPNNSGKSSILDAVRILESAIRYARRRRPELVRDETGQVHSGYLIPNTLISINLENVHTNYRDVTTRIRYWTHQDHLLTIEVTPDGVCKLLVDPEIGHIKSTTEFVRFFDEDIAGFPTLGPFEQEELIVTDQYFRAWWGSRRSPRLFRNYWFKSPDRFEEFQALIENTWPEMSIIPPEQIDVMTRQISMFYKERRFDREIYWSGFGFQVWLQLLTHIISRPTASIVVVDEPDIYLHPDLQIKLMNILRNHQAQVIVATHSVEIVNEAERNEVLIIDPDKVRSRRISDLEGFQDAVSVLGSTQNIELARLSRGRKVIFFEGQDFKVLRRIADRIGLSELAAATEVSVISIGGISQRTRIKDAAWTFEEILKSEVRFAALFDRDYRSDEEIAEFIESLEDKLECIHVFKKKELENYLIIPKVIERAVIERLEAREDELATDTKKISRIVKKLIRDTTDELKNIVNAQKCAHNIRFFAGTGIDESTIVSDTIQEIDKQWKDLNYRINMVPGKDAISSINKKLQDSYGISITYPLLVKHMRAAEVPEELRNILESFNNFANS